MPELPETETIARDLDGALRGAVISSVAVVQADILRDPRRGGRALRGQRATALGAALRDRLEGECLTGISRRAKSIVLRIGSGDAIVVTPRFTGALLIGSAGGIAESATSPAQPPAFEDRYDCVRLTLADGRRLTYRDVRRLGTVALMSPSQLAAWDATLGPEPLDPALTAERFAAMVRSSRRAVKSILMDQRRLAGVGNIYANEACFRAGIRPMRRGDRISDTRSTTLLHALRAVLSASIAMRGTTFRDFQDAYGGRGGFAEQLQVYGRGGEPCVRCGCTLSATHALEGRSTVWCRRCQR